MLYTGDIILESLVDPSVLAEFSAYRAQARTETHADFVPPLWNIERYRLPHEKLQELLPRLVNNIRASAWYIHFYSEETNAMYVTLSGRIFPLPKYRDASWDEMIAYGEKVGVGRRWLENIPVDFAA